MQSPAAPNASLDSKAKNKQENKIRHRPWYPMQSRSNQVIPHLPCTMSDQTPPRQGLEIVVGTVAHSARPNSAHPRSSSKAKIAQNAGHISLQDVGRRAGRAAQVWFIYFVSLRHKSFRCCMKLRREQGKHPKKKENTKTEYMRPTRVDGFSGQLATLY